MQEIKNYILDVIYFLLFKKRVRKFYDRNGNLHREGKPAVEYPDGTVEYHHHGLLHNSDGPAIIYTNGDKEYWVNDKLHRECGPAIDKDWVKMWAINGVLHREGKPAVIRKTGEKAYFNNGRMYFAGDHFRIDTGAGAEMHSFIGGSKFSPMYIQVNGKNVSSAYTEFRSTAKDCEKIAIEDDKVKELLKDKKLVKTVCIPGKVINFVVRDK